VRGLFLCLNILVFVYLNQIILKLTELKSEYHTALRAAVEASEKIMEIYLNGFETEFKLDGSPVTQADLAASTIIDSYLETTGIPITSEESIKIDYDIRKEWKESWCVDPLDGTREFVKKNGEFVVNIALISDGVPVFGIIASPVNRKILVGGRKIGVYLIAFHDLTNLEHWVKLETPKNVNIPLIITCSRSHDSGPILDFLKELQPKHPEINFIKKGSALKFFDLAEGKADAYPRFAPTMEWDIAAGQAILEALGGTIVHAATNQSLVYNKSDLTNPSFLAKSNALLKMQ